MERVVKKFRSFAEAEAAELEYMRSLTGNQRLQLLLDLLRSNQPEHEQRLERVYCIVKLPRR